MSRTLYPVKTQPVFVPSETINADKWHQSLSEPRRGRSLAIAAVAGSVFVPVVPTPGDGVGAVPSITIDTPRVQSFQYQVSAVPVQVAAPETITADKWHEPLSEPVRPKVGLGAVYQQPVTLAKADPFPESVTSDRWLRAFSEPVRKPRAIGRDAEFVSVVAAVETITLDKWFAAFSDPARRRGLGAQQQQAAIYLYPVPVSGSGTGAVPYTAFATPRVQSFQYQVSTAPVMTPTGETITADKWHVPFLPPTRRGGLGVQQQQSVALVKDTPFAESVTADRWFAPFSLPVRRRQIPFGFATTFVGDAQSLSGVSWYSPWAPPVGGGFAVIDTSSTFIAIENVTEDRWHQPWSEPVRSRPALSAANQRALSFTQAAPFAETVSVDRWLQSYSEPIRIRRGRGPDSAFVPYVPAVSGDGVGAVPTNWTATPVVQSFQYQISASVSFVPPAEVVTSDKWYRPFTDPTRRIGLPTAEQQAAALVQASPFAETVLVDRWQVALSEPVRRKRVVSSDFVTLLGVPVDIGWLAPFSMPARSKLATLGPSVAFVFAPATGETITVDKWLYQFSEPVRSKPGLLVANQQAFAFVKAAPFAETVSIDRWLQGLSDPTRRKYPTTLYIPATWLDAFPRPAAAPITISNWFADFSVPTRRTVSPIYRFEWAGSWGSTGIPDAPPESPEIHNLPFLVTMGRLRTH